MIIEFPKKYSVRMFDGTGSVAVGGAFVSLPAEYRAEAMGLFSRQPWINGVYSKPSGDIHVYISRAYEITDEQAYAALRQLCEHVMSPPVEVDREVWGDAV
jgi:hypothetical protein